VTGKAFVDQERQKISARVKALAALSKSLAKVGNSRRKTLSLLGAEVLVESAGGLGFKSESVRSRAHKFLGGARRERASQPR
jgi:hypothetical protein